MYFKNLRIINKLMIPVFILAVMTSLFFTGFAYAQDETGECLYMKEACMDLQDYKNNWKKLTASKKKGEAKEKIRQALTQRCNEAKKLCKESESKKKKAK
jgi:hypothetical protein